MEIRGRRTVFALLRLRELRLYLMYSGLCIRARNGRNRGQGRGCFRKSHSQRPKIVSFLNSRAGWRGGTGQLHNSCIQNRANHSGAAPIGGCAGHIGGCAGPIGGCAGPIGRCAVAFTSFFSTVWSYPRGSCPWSQVRDARRRGRREHTSHRRSRR